MHDELIGGSPEDVREAVIVSLQNAIRRAVTVFQKAGALASELGCLSGQLRRERMKTFRMAMPEVVLVRFASVLSQQIDREKRLHQLAGQMAFALTQLPLSVVMDRDLLIDVKAILSEQAPHAMGNMVNLTWERRRRLPRNVCLSRTVNDIVASCLAVEADNVTLDRDIDVLSSMLENGYRS
jgi:hypothetical protein